MPTGRNTALTDTVALDCEMVGVGEDGRRSILVRG
jgi:RNA exonuclease 4